MILRSNKKSPSIWFDPLPILSLFLSLFFHIASVSYLFNTGPIANANSSNVYGDTWCLCFRLLPHDASSAFNERKFRLGKLSGGSTACPGKHPLMANWHYPWIMVSFFIAVFQTLEWFSSITQCCIGVLIKQREKAALPTADGYVCCGTEGSHRLFNLM